LPPRKLRETIYWLKLLERGKLADGVSFENEIEKCSELIRMLTSIVKTSQTKNVD
jgi:four helix bundle protein